MGTDSATELPAFIIKRLPVRFTYDNNYFNDTGIRAFRSADITKMVERMLERNCEVRLLDTDFLKERENAISALAEQESCIPE